MNMSNNSMFGDDDKKIRKSSRSNEEDSDVFWDISLSSISLNHLESISKLRLKA